ncbi:MAG TPA: type II CAAX endopeptidase family protein [Chthoniobacterales bacterium]|jgi:membrane protease YdiL (CAAX protease family)|nr:type II CAAX endopeptidase family protein [Chthoniobacterales bacterium]
MSAKLLFVIEVLVIATVFHLDYLGFLPVSKTPYLFLLGWISIRLRRQRWKDVGLKLDQSFLKLLALGIVVGVAMEALELFATQPFLTKILGQGPDLHQLQPLVGNTQLLLLGIVLAWILAAFGEETVYRGYLLNRCADLFGKSTTAWMTSTILVTLLFGFAHFPQGPTGIIENIIDGAILAATYFATGRNLWAPIVAHGIQDTVDVLLIYLGWYPGFQQSVGLPA